MKIIFWNIGGVCDDSLLEELILCLGGDIIFLAECKGDRAITVMSHVNILSSSYYEIYDRGISNVLLITRLPSSLFMPIYDDTRFSIRSLNVPATSSILNIVAVHLPSKVSAGAGRQYYYTRKLRAQIEEAEIRSGTNHTLVLGDFNFNPFEEAMIAIDGLNAVMDRAILSKAQRTMYDVQWSAFYNPMWSFYGDMSRGPSGTHFYRSSEPTCLFWNMFDQVIMRPSLVEFFDFSKLIIHTTIGNRSLLDNFCSSNALADHLPMSIELNVEGRLK